jgi:SpoVK/Ycf46/Vps4 family AAA+-type ATPase
MNYKIENLAEMSKGFSYADITSSVKSAVRKKAEEISRRSSNKRIPGRITQRRLEESLNIHKEKFGILEKRIGF